MHINATVINQKIISVHSIIEELTTAQRVIRKNI
jgi:hypothetical protein